MSDGTSSRTWDSVCGDCTHCRGSLCCAGYITDGSDDCIAAVCLGFEPKTKEGDA